MENKIALDIVLLLPQDIRTLCADMDRGSERSKEVSFDGGYEPHITLSMGCVEVARIDEIVEKIKTVLATVKPLELSLVGVHTGQSSWLSVAKTEEIFTLHQTINAIMKEFSTYDATRECFFESDIHTIKDSLVDWVNNFPVGASDDAYDAHISLGKEHVYLPVFPIHFTALTVGMFHLGFHGTCKNRLRAYTLGA